VDKDNLDPKYSDKRKDALFWIAERVDGEVILDAGSDNKVFQIIISNLNKKSDHIPKGELVGAIDQDNQQDCVVYDTVIVSDSGVDPLPESARSRIDTLLRPGGRLLILQKFQDSSKGIAGISLQQHVANEFFKIGYRMNEMAIIGNGLKMPFSWLCVSLNKIELPLNESTASISGDDIFIYSNKILNLIQENYNAEKNDVNWLKNEYLKLLSITSESLNQMQARTGYLLGVPETSGSKDNLEKIDYSSSSTSDDRQMLVSRNNSDSEVQQKYESVLIKLKECVSLLEREIAEEERLIKINADLSIKLTRAESRYRALANSKTGRMTLLYWKFLKNTK
jgi:hypothetical protein